LDCSNIDPGVFVDLATDILQSGGQRSSAVKEKEPAVKKSRPVSELNEDEQLQLAMNASMADHPVVIDDSPVAAEPDLFDSIVAGEEIPEPEGDTTRIQFRCPGMHLKVILVDGQRIVRKFRKDDLVRALFSYVKSRTDVVGASRFDLSFVRVSLMGKIGESIEGADLLNGAVMIEVTEES
jgi:hypothetical protein